MLNREELVSLYRKHRDEPVLTIYLDAEEHDPAKRRAWRRSFDHVVDYARSHTSDGDSARFDRALDHLRRELRQYDAFLPDRGWAGYATPDSLLYAETLPVPMPNLARFEPGLRVAPYVRALRQSVPVITVLVDSRQARIFRLRGGEFEELPEVRADMFYGDLSDINMSKRATTHSGVRGETDTDAAHRFEEVGSERLLKHLVDRLTDEAGTDGVIVVGGTAEMSAAVLQRLTKPFDDRAAEDQKIAFYTSTAELKRASEATASAIHERRQQRLLDQVIELAGARGRGCLGRAPTEKALIERRVDVLLLSPRLTAQDPEYADSCVGAAFEQDATVEELTGAAAERLDSEGGIGARLRY